MKRAAELPQVASTSHRVEEVLLDERVWSTGRCALCRTAGISVTAVAFAVLPGGGSPPELRCRRCLRGGFRLQGQTACVLHRPYLPDCGAQWGAHPSGRERGGAR